MTIPVEIIGIGLGIDDITEKQKKIINKADLLIAGSRYLDYFKKIRADKLAIKKDINLIAGEIKLRMAKEKIVVLASGDPLFFGIGSSLIKKLGRKNIIIHPNVSSVISAFARIKEPWHDVFFISLHGKKVPPDFKNFVLGRNKIAILTDPVKNPAWIARKLVKENCIDFEFHVFENLGRKEEKIFHFNDVNEATGLNFKSPSVVILKRKDIPDLQVKILKCQSKIKDKSINTNEFKYGRKDRNKIVADTENLNIYPGMPDHLFSHEKGLITKAEVRAVVLSKLKLISDSHVLWDLGAGSGSISIEASKSIPEGSVFAVEKNMDRIFDIKKNIEKFRVPNINIIHANLPDGIEDLSEPDRVFIGGGGRGLLKIIGIAIERLAANGVIVISIVILQNIEPCLNFLIAKGFSTNLVQLQVSCSKPMPFGHRLEALNPVWIISGERS